MCNILIWSNWSNCCHTNYDRTFVVVRQILIELSSMLEWENIHISASKKWLSPEPALNRCNSCSCIGPRASEAPRHGVWVDCSFLLDTPCAWEFSRNTIQISLTKNALIRTSTFPLERQQMCSILVLVQYCISALYYDRNTVDWTRWRHKNTARGAPRLGLELGPALRSCIGPRIC